MIASDKSSKRQPVRHCNGKLADTCPRRKIQVFLTMKRSARTVSQLLVFVITGILWVLNTRMSSLYLATYQESLLRQLKAERVVSSTPARRRGGNVRKKLSNTVTYQKKKRDTRAITPNNVTHQKKRRDKRAIAPKESEATKGKLCKGEECNEQCLDKQLKSNSTFPLFWDPMDNLCKTQNPAVLSRYGSFCSCNSTCFTPQAAEDTERARVWPWSNQSERLLYHTNDPEVKKASKLDFAKGCNTRRFDQEYSEYRARFDCNTNMTNKTIPLPFYGAFEHHMYFVPKAKLIFCGVPKAGVTEWISFFRFVNGAKDYLSLPHFKQDIDEFKLSSLTVKKASELFFDPTWTKAVLFRDPAERLLSAYLDKIQGSGYTQKVFWKDNTTLSFEEFVEYLTMPANFVNGSLEYYPRGHGLHGLTDPHWRPQSMMCGLDYLLPHIDFVGNFNFVSEQTKLLLERVGLWDDYGAKFDIAKDKGYSKGDRCSRAPLSEGDHGFNASRVVPGFNQKGVSGTHSTGSKTKLEEFYTPSLMEKVRKAYALDFAIFEDLQERAAKRVDNIASGKSLKAVQSYCEREKPSIIHNS